MKRIVSAAASLLLMGATGLALADTPPPPPKPIHHPRIHEVHDRMRDQEKRIEAGLKAGTLTPAQAKALRDVLKSVHAQMEADYKANGKRELTPDQQKQLNQLLDENSKTIYGEKHDDSSAPAANGSAGSDSGSSAGSSSSNSSSAGSSTGAAAPAGNANGQ